MSYDEVIKAISSGFAQFTWLDVLDIIIICVLLYKLIIWTKETRAYEVLKGLGLLFLCSVASQLLQLNTLSWLLDAFLKSGTIIVGKKVGRNDPCPCGSGKKYKQCCGR